jgi:hypothetical protein
VGRKKLWAFFARFKRAIFFCTLSRAITSLRVKSLFRASNQASEKKASFETKTTYEGQAFFGFNHINAAKSKSSKPSEKTITALQSSLVVIRLFSEHALLTNSYLTQKPSP